jgi:hypothetical protein
MWDRVVHWVLRRLMAALHRRHIVLVAGLSGWALTVLFGMIGFGCHYYGFLCVAGDPEPQLADPRPSWSTIVYLAFQLIVLESGVLPGRIPLMLEVARVFGTVSTAITTFTALLELFASQLEDWLLRKLQGHVVVCGFGNKGAPLVEDLVYWGLDLVVVEQHPREADIARLHGRGVHVVAGDATDRSVLFRAGCERASYVVVASGNDATEVAVAHQVVEAVMLNPTASPSRPVLYLHIQDPRRQAEVEAFLRAQSVGKPGEPQYWQMVNMYDRVARSILAKHFVFDREEVKRRTVPETFTVVPGYKLTLAVVGDAPLADSLIDNLLRAWRPRHAQRQEQLHLVVIGKDAKQRIEKLEGRRPDLRTVCLVRDVPQNVTDLTPDELPIHLAGVSTIYICHETDTAAAAAVFALWPQAASQNARVIVSFDRRVGPPDLVRQASVVRMTGRAERLVTFSLAEAFLGADLGFERETAKLAEIIHRDYLKAREDDRKRVEALLEALRKEGHPEPPAPPYNPYLDEKNLQGQAASRLSSLRQAQHVLHKLDLVGCTIRSKRGAVRPRFRFTDPERKALAILEHDRWNDERLLDGWDVGKPTDRINKIHENLVLWDLVPSNVQEYDFQAIDGLPERLAEAGFEIVRKRRA